MKNNKQTGILFMLLGICVMFFTLSSCGTKEEEKPKVGANVIPSSVKPKHDLTLERSKTIDYPVRIQFIKYHEMTYMVVSGVGNDAGASARNVTLDSLEVQYYKQQLNKQ